jgi:hypothetical protein
MANLVDIDAASGDHSLFGGYEAELKLIQADLAQKVDEIPDLSGEPRKSVIGQAERALQEAEELVCAMVSSLCMAGTLTRIYGKARTDASREAKHTIKEQDGGK